MKIHGTAKGGAISKKDFGVAFSGAGGNGTSLTWEALNSKYLVDNSASPNPKAWHYETTGAGAGYATSDEAYSRGEISIIEITGGENDVQALNIGFTYFGDGSGIPSDEDPRNQSNYDDRGIFMGLTARNDGTIRIIYDGSDGEGSYDYDSDDEFKIKLNADNCEIYQNDSLIHTIDEVPPDYDYYVYFNSPYILQGDPEDRGFVYANIEDI